MFTKSQIHNLVSIDRSAKAGWAAGYCMPCTHRFTKRGVAGCEEDSSR